MTPDVSITGASGFVGGHLASTLIAQGSSVRALVRSDEAAAKVEALGATPHRVDLFDPEGMKDALWGSQLLFHVAGVNETCSKDPPAMDRTNIEGTRAVVRASAEAGVGRIVYTSSAATIGEPQGTIGHEETTHTGDYLSPYARSKHRAEQAAFAAAEECRIDLVSVNPSSVQGPGRSTGSARILQYALRDGRPRLFNTTVSIVDIDDCSAGHVAAGERGRRGERYLLSGSTFSVAEAVAMVAELTDRTIDPRWLSESLVRTWGGMAARIAQVAKPSAGLCPALIRTLLHGHRFDGSKAERELGITYTPLEETFTRTLRWFEAEGLIDGR